MSFIFNSNNTINELELNIESTLSLETMLGNHMNEQIEHESPNFSVRFAPMIPNDSKRSGHRFSRVNNRNT